MYMHFLLKLAVVVARAGCPLHDRQSHLYVQVQIRLEFILKFDNKEFNFMAFLFTSLDEHFQKLHFLAFFLNLDSLHSMWSSVE